SHTYLPSFPTRRSSDLVLVDEELDEALEERGPLLGRRAGEPQGLAYLARLEVGQAKPDVDRLTQDLLRRVVSDRLDLDAPLGRRSEEHTSELQSRENLV